MHIENPDVILIGSGVMSANLGALLKKLDPKLRIQLYEVADDFAQEASNAWNNAGTGHAGICELSYTPDRRADGSVNVDKAFEVFEQFEQTRQFWAYAVRSGMIENPSDFINPVPHLSFVHGQEQVDFLKDRHAALSKHHFFADMVYTTDRAQIDQWAPLLMDGRADVPVAVTRMDNGTDVNFGELSRKLIDWLAKQDGCGAMASHRVTNLTKTDDLWEVEITNLKTGDKFTNTAKFVFVGAGGGSLPLLQKAKVPEAHGYGAFPIGGQWLVCDDPEIVARHEAKVYGQAQDEAPTMAVPHLDTRVINGKKAILFGPFASWTMKFLHQGGSQTDLMESVKPSNLFTLLKVGAFNLGLVKYLVQEGLQSMKDRMDVLHRFFPAAEQKDWKLIDAGIRVQAITEEDGSAGIVHFGTEVVTSADKSISSLLGASPGASVCVNVMIEAIEKSFPHLLSGDEGKAIMAEMVPTYGVNLVDDPECYAKVRPLADAALEV